MPGPSRLAGSIARLARLLASALAAIAVLPADASLAATRTLKFGYILTPDSQLGKGEQVFAAEIATRTNDRYAIENYPNAMLGGETAMIKDVQLGALDLAFITGAPLPKVVPAAGIFNIPFLFHDAAAARAVLDGPIGEGYLRMFDGAGVVGLAWGENGMRQLTNSKRPIKAPGDLKGLRIRLPQSDVMAAGFKALGAEVEQIPFPEVYGALRGGRADGEENPIATILSSRFYEVQHYLTLSSHVYDPAIILMSQDAFDALSDADKAAFREAARLAARESRVAATTAEQNGIAALKAFGVNVVQDVDRAAFLEAVSTASPVFDHLFGHEAIERLRNAAAAAAAPSPTQASR